MHEQIPSALLLKIGCKSKGDCVMCGHLTSKCRRIISRQGLEVLGNNPTNTVCKDIRTYMPINVYILTEYVSSTYVHLLVQVVPLHILQQDEDFMRYVTRSNNR